MKSSISVIPVLFFSLWLPCLCAHAQEVATKWDVEIPRPISDGTPSTPVQKPEPIDYEVLSTRTTRMDVIEAPEMPDLPPITGTISVTVQLVAAPNLPDPPPPLPALPPEDPAVIARLAELTEKYRGTELIFLSAAVYDHNRTFIEIYPNGKRGGAVSAWSNLNFNHFSGFATFRITDGVDGTIHDFGLLMGIGNVSTAAKQLLAAKADSDYQEQKIPSLPDLADGGPSFIVVDGDVDSPAMDTLEQIHDLYRKEGVRMEEAYHAREKVRAERKAFLLANPPKPDDVSVQFWKREPASPADIENPKEEGRP